MIVRSGNRTVTDYGPTPAPEAHRGFTGSIARPAPAPAPKLRPVADPMYVTNWKRMKRATDPAWRERERTRDRARRARNREQAA